MKHSFDRFAGKAYNGLLAAVLVLVAFVAMALGTVILLTGSVLFGLVWLAAGMFFGYVARRCWRSRASLRETFDGHG